MSKPVIPHSVLTRALVMRANGISWGRIAREVGFGEERIRRVLEPGFSERRAAGIREARYTRPMRGEPKARLSPLEARRALDSIPPDTRSMSARLMGDPLPGRSALDKLSMRERTKNRESRETGHNLLAPSKTGVSIEDHLSNGRVV